MKIVSVITHYDTVEAEMKTVCVTDKHENKLTVCYDHQKDAPERIALAPWMPAQFNDDAFTFADMDQKRETSELLDEMLDVSATAVHDDDWNDWTEFNVEKTTLMVDIPILYLDIDVEFTDGTRVTVFYARTHQSSDFYWDEDALNSNKFTDDNIDAILDIVNNTASATHTH